MWTVRRRWLRRPRWRAPQPDGADVADAAFWLPFDAVDSIGALLLGLAIGVLVVALLVFALPAILFLAGLAVALGGLVLRLLAIRPWTVEARAGYSRLEWQARGWRRSGRVLDEVAAALQLGRTDVRPDEALYRGRGV
jgi:hypothetical protein